MELLSKERWDGLVRMAKLDIGDTKVNVYGTDFIMNVSILRRGDDPHNPELIGFRYRNVNRKIDTKFSYSKERVGWDAISTRSLEYLRLFWDKLTIGDK